jgi:hypothetical protein
MTQRLGTYLITLAVLAGAGCGSLPQQQTRLITPFNYSEHDKYLGPGNATLRGQAFMRQPGGAVVTCAGSQVLAMPATTFFRELTAVARTGQTPRVANDIDPNYRSIIKRSPCDTQGYFVFNDLVAGTWIIGAEVHWTAAGQVQGGSLMREIEVRRGDNPQLMLTDADRIR